MEHKPKNIIVRLPNWIGDLVMGTPILMELKKQFPDAKLTVMCRKPLGELLLKDPNVDEIFSFTKPKGALRRCLDRSVIGQLRQGKYDLGLLLTNSFSSAWIFLQGKIKKRIGFRGNFRSLFLTHPIDFPKNLEALHQVELYKLLLKPLGIDSSLSSPKLYLAEEEIIKAKARLKTYGITDNHIVIGINPGAAYGSAKCWLPERFKEVSLKLLEVDPKIRIVFFGDENISPLIKSICYELPPSVINLAATTSIRELMALIKSCHLFLTNDSGPMHIADALEVPLIALFGSTNSIKTGPYHQKERVIQKKVECSPCYKRVCPIDFRCMKKITTDDVYEAILQTLRTLEDE